MNLKMQLDLFRCYCSSNNSTIGALRMYKKETKLKENLYNRSTIVKLMKKFENIYFLQDLPKFERKWFFMIECL